MRKILRFVLWTAIILGVIVGVSRYLAIRWWRIPSDDPFLEASIGPSLRGGDLVILWRATAPNRGDLAICPEPGAPHRVVIGRIAGLEDDTLEIADAGVAINNRFQSTERACPVFTIKDPNSGVEVEQNCDIEVIGGHGHMRGSGSGTQKRKFPRRFKQQTIPAGKLFLLSDNRLFPYDSRDFGLVDRDTCKETVVFRILGKEGFSDTESRFTFIH
jgi:signal peptidase I